MNDPKLKVFLTLSKISTAAKSIQDAYAVERNARSRDFKARKWKTLGDYEGFNAYNASPASEEASRLLDEANAMIQKAMKVLEGHQRK
jgi:hypothetical protein